MGGTISSSLTNAPDGKAGSVPWLSAAAALLDAACPSGVRAMHSAASSAVAKQPRPTVLPPRLTRA
jgi:hypothetical protein